MLAPPGGSAPTARYSVMREVTHTLTTLTCEENVQTK